MAVKGVEFGIPIAWKFPNFKEILEDKKKIFFKLTKKVASIHGKFCLLLVAKNFKIFRTLSKMYAVTYMNYNGVHYTVCIVQLLLKTIHIVYTVIKCTFKWIQLPTGIHEICPTFQLCIVSVQTKVILFYRGLNLVSVINQTGLQCRLMWII